MLDTIADVLSKFGHPNHVFAQVISRVSSDNTLPLSFRRLVAESYPDG
jgi:hypothetical protein